ncbi:NAD(P)-dependent oxidoreductase [Nocardia puris]|uniref:NAD(P)-dependent oxidoreductase n=1 Tax=Nocardia puris TaxID=208602 RepID=UPI0018961DBE|nr:NAD(P)-dependent oxidoreductase [Nocardia puris]MBF6211243.1 NAD(P)-dependent oxidoreductase [Nocardia puris]MBF6364962.1 NAD(P)-dependent oxidoreductase [Nocardia puris]MBF6458748.1 NAD(P)-dependent oxidoreductase [Nocardia puris]
MSNSNDPVLIIGGSGVVGSLTARQLRRLHPGLPLAIGGRDLARAEAVAAEVGNAVGVTVDLARPDLGLPADAAFSAVAVFVKDATTNSLRYALTHRLPYISVSTGTYEIGPEVALHIHHPGRSAVVLGSHWLAGAAIFPVLKLAADFERVDDIRIGVVLDGQDMGGQAAADDYERLTTVAPAALTIRDGKVTWVTGDEAAATVRSVDGVELEGQAYSPFDIIGLHAATDARDIRLDFAFGDSASTRRGEPFSTEIIADLSGVRKDGTRARVHAEIVHPQGQAPLTALGVTLAVERLIGLDGRPAPEPGLYLPENILAPVDFVRRMEEFGATVATSSDEAVSA